MNYIAILVISVSILFVANLLGNKLAKLLHLKSELQYTALGLAAILAVLFVVYVPFVYFQSSAQLTNMTFIIILILISGYALYDLFKHFDYDPKLLLFTLVYVAFMVYLSSRITLGEQTGDSNFYFTIVQRNVDSSILGQFQGYNGGMYERMVVHLGYRYQAFYQFFSAILWSLRSLFNDIFVDHAIYMWVANIIFYFISFEAITNTYQLFKSKMSFIINIIFVGFFLGSIYYNLTLPHVGVIFMTVLLTNEVIYLFVHYEVSDISCKWILFIFAFSIISCFSGGVYTTFFLAYSYIASKIIKGNKNIINDIWMIAFPIMIYSILYMNNIRFTLACIMLETLFIIISFAMKKYIKIRQIMPKIAKLIVIFIPIIIVLISAYFIRPDDYGQYITKFIFPFSQGDRVQDYFVFNSLEMILKNTLYYVALVSLLIANKTRSYAYVLIFCILTFANPLVMPFVVRYMTGPSVYQRTFYIVFNAGFIMLGFNMLLTNIIKKDWLKKVVFSGLIIVYSGLAYQGITVFYHNIYVPSANFNPLYKAHQSQIDTVNALSYEIKSKGLICPTVITQIDATLMLEPNITLINGVAQRHKPNTSYGGNSLLNELVTIFHSPLFDGDDANRFNSDYKNVGQLLDEAGIKFVIVKKSLHVTNDLGEWVPLYTYLLDNTILIYENEDYMLYSNG